MGFLAYIAPHVGPAHTHDIRCLVHHPLESGPVLVFALGGIVLMVTVMIITWLGVSHSQESSGPVDPHAGH
jgi:hypothetical protein